MDKKAVRKSILARRSSIDPITHSEYSGKICEKIMELAEYKQARSVMAYYPIHNEVDIMPLLLDILKNKSLLLPRISSDKCMRAAIVSSLDELTDGIFCTREPNRSCNEILLREIDAAIVPLVAFGMDCARIGYGGGYYDRFLAGASLYKIGAAFEMQRAGTLNCQAHDVKMNVIVTEKKLYLPR